MPTYLVGRTGCTLVSLLLASVLSARSAGAQTQSGVASSSPTTSNVDTVARRITGVLIKAGPDLTAGVGRIADVGMGFSTDVGRIPQSVYVISKQLLFEQQPSTLSEIVRNIPGVSAARVTAETFRGFKLRGFPVTETVTDGIRNTGSLNIQPDGLASLERVEVMTGPSGAIFGQAGGGGGAVNLVTKKPLSVRRYEATFGAGESGLLNGTVDAGGPLTSGKSLRYRLVGGYDERQSVIDFVEPKAFQVAPSLEWTRGVTSVLYQLDWREREQIRFHSLPFVGTLVGRSHVQVERDLFTGEPAQGLTKNHGLQQTVQLRRIIGQKTLARVYARLTANSYFQPSVTPRTIQADSVHLNRRFTLFDDAEDEIVAGAQIARRDTLAGAEHVITVGADASRWEYNSRLSFGTVAAIDLANPVYGSPISNVNLIDDTGDRWTNTGAFVQDLIALTPSVTLLAGVRADRLTNFTQSRVSNTSGDLTRVSVSPRVGATWEIRPGTVAFASYSRGFIANPFAGSLPSPEGTPFEPQRSIGYETGVKLDLPGSALLGASLFQLDRTNVPTADPDDATRQVTTGEQRTRGAELALAWEPTSFSSVLANYARTSALLVRDNTFTPGNRIENVPENTARLWGKVEKPFGAGAALGATFGLTYASDVAATLANTIFVPGYTVLDAGLVLRTSRGDVQLLVQNLTDRHYYARGAFGGIGVIPGEARRIMLSTRIGG